MLYLYCKAHAAWAYRDQGASAVEYGLLIAAVAAIIVVTAFTLGGRVLKGFHDTCTNMPASPTGPATC